MLDDGSEIRRRTPLAQRGADTRDQVIPPIMSIGAFHPLPPMYLPGDTIQTLDDEAQSRAKEAVARAHEILREAHIETVTPEFLATGDARAVILNEAKDWGADLIVLGSHGYHGIDRFMLGSVSESVAVLAHCSVEIIRHSTRTASK
jgi:nucleotide-binding universal stress UspA family protein